MKNITILLVLCLFTTVVSASPKEKSSRRSASRFVESQPRIGDYGLLRAATKFRISRPGQQAWRFTPRPVADLMMPKSAPRPRRQTSGGRPEIEFFAGYSYTFFAASEGGASLHGWNADVAVFPFKHVGLVADFAGGYISDTLIEDDSVLRGDGRLLTFLFGPRVRGGNDRVSAFVQGVVGVAHGKVSGSITIPGQPTDRGSLSETAFSLAAGGGVDLKLSDRISLRIFKTEYLLTRFFDFNQHSVRASTGLVFH
ncbi:MAG TPA: hypothetical protein VNQ79_02085 [Blastocatellia bacterium]|nr:hypothetical protein [Blastocatellia bacterium]